MGRRPTRVLLVTGLPATGKTTLARRLARRWSAPLLAKDVIKEPLLDVLRAADAAASRRLSDVSFAILFALAREHAAAGVSVVLEGNFRPEEHAHCVRGLPSPLECAQVLCLAEEAVRIGRLGARASDAARHAGHRDAELARAASRPAEYLDLAGERFLFAGTESPDWPELLERLDRWWQGGRARRAGR